ncbi:MAG: GH32 C-terminal domain-containing protein [Candidatus Hydrogenedentales bacterium]|jgi:sucrose-6-phosphate hydrolase SacC (GH32 family)
MRLSLPRIHHWGNRSLIAFVGIASSFLAVAKAPEMPTLTDKTLVAWLYLNGLDQRGGSALTLDDRKTHFDGIVFGEVAPGKWMAGSNGFSRTAKDQGANPAESAGPKTCVQIAVVYRGKEITLFRDGQPYTHYTIDGAQSFGPGSVVVMGLRHLEATDHACLAGAIDDARIYGSALTPEQIASLKPDQASDPKPLAWWTFQDGRVRDEMGLFPETLLMGNARVEDGKLVLDGKGSFLVAAPDGLAAQTLSPPQANDTTRIARAHRMGLIDDPQRPAYHLVVPEGICMPFDPNGALYWKGKYHLSYIYQDERGCCWGHASSVDLVHWQFHPTPLFPGPGDVDQGMFSGNAFVNLKGEATALYHGVNAGNCIATSSDDDLIHWTKLASNPIVPNPKEGDPDFGKYTSWDPHGWVEGDTYYGLFGGMPGSGVPATLFKGKDLDKWEYVGNFLDHDLPEINADDDISCPDFFKIGDKHMLLCISHKRGCRYYLGRWENEKFYPETHAWMNWPGGTFFAPESLLDNQGRRIMWAWVLDFMPGQEPPKTGWSGTMSLPRHLWLADDGTLRMAPVKEVEALRYDPRHKEGIALADGKPVTLDDVHGECLDLALEIQPGDAKQIAIAVRRSPNGEEETPIIYDAAAGTLRVELGKSSQGGYLKHVSYIVAVGGGDNPEVTAQVAPFKLNDGEPLRLRILLDRSILEIFANERQALTQRIDPTRPDSVGIALSATGGNATVKTLDAWAMAATNPW